MSDTGFTVPGMTELPRCCDVTSTVDRDGGDHPNPAEFAAAAEEAASARAASIVSAHTPGRSSAPSPLVFLIWKLQNVDGYLC